MARQDLKIMIIGRLGTEIYEEQVWGSDIAQFDWISLAQTLMQTAYHR